MGRSEFLPEIWALGLCNLKYSFTPQGRLLVADVIKMVRGNFQIGSGDNGGWKTKEGSTAFHQNRIVPPTGWLTQSTNTVAPMAGPLLVALS